MATILITGGTGLVGSALARSLQQQGHTPMILTRRPEQQRRTEGWRYAAWNVEAQTIDAQALAEADAIVHLAGAGVADARWTEKRKQEIVDSRVRSGQLLCKALRELPNKVKTVVSASAIGWYGADPELPNLRPFVETDPADGAFLGRTCAAWEAAIRPVEELDKRLVIARIGIVLSRDGGAYAEFRKPMQFGLAAVMGNGRQVVSWIHIDDLVRLISRMLQDDCYRGIYNAVAPQPVANRRLVQAIARAKGGFHLEAPAPAMVLKMILGEMSIEVLKSATVSSRKAEAAGFVFNFPHIEGAAGNLEQRP